jgi:5'-3' exonuclease
VTAHLLLIDASAIAYRAFHAANPVYRSSDGQPVGAVLKFMEISWRLLGAAEADKPTHGAAVFDCPGKTFRHRLDPQYKANRDPARKVELGDQFPFMRHAAETLGLHPVERKGFEADDVIATLAVRAKRLGMRVTIVSSDKDFGQLVEDGKIEIVDPLARRRMREADIRRKMGVPPHRVADLQALWGDAVDNIPGVPGVGKEKGAQLIRAFGDLEGVLARADECGWPQVRAQLKRHADRARLNMKLTTLRRDVILSVDPGDLGLAPVMKAHLVEILKALEASHYMEAIFALDPQMTRLVPHAKDPEEWWREELAAKGQPVPETPQAGCYERKLVHGAPFVPARIWRIEEVDDDGRLTGMDILRCDLGGKPKDPFAEWTRLAMRPISREDYDHAVADVAHLRKWQPDHPKANPTQKPDLSAQPVSRNPNPVRKRS